MINFESANKKIQITFEENESVQICPKCSSPNSMQSGYCIDCDRKLQTPKIKTCKVEEVVRCPVCGHFNTCNDTVCSNRDCLAALDKVCAQDTTAESEPQHEETVCAVEYVKRCLGCGHVNRPNASECEGCGETLEFVDPELKNQCEEDPTALIINVATRAKVKLEKDICYTIGRREFLREQLEFCSFVSGEHLKITWDGAQFLLEDVSRNGTYINGMRIEKNKEIVVAVGTEVMMGDASSTQPLAAHYRLEKNAD